MSVFVHRILHGVYLLCLEFELSFSLVYLLHDLIAEFLVLLVFVLQIDSYFLYSVVGFSQCFSQLADLLLSAFLILRQTGERAESFVEIGQFDGSIIFQSFLEFVDSDVEEVNRCLKVCELVSCLFIHVAHEQSDIVYLLKVSLTHFL